jgi:endogenous inhibitor of DNA gyrase (YacG/DUF329 family)
MSEAQYAGLRDPLVTGHCPKCGKARVPLTGIAKGAIDPFCSTACVKAWYGVQVERQTEGELRGSAQAAQRYKRDRGGQFAVSGWAG